MDKVAQLAEGLKKLAQEQKYQPPTMSDMAPVTGAGVAAGSYAMDRGHLFPQKLRSIDTKTGKAVTETIKHSRGRAALVAGLGGAGAYGLSKVFSRPSKTKMAKSAHLVESLKKVAEKTVKDWRKEMKHWGIKDIKRAAKADTGEEAGRSNQDFAIAARAMLEEK